MISIDLQQSVGGIVVVRVVGMPVVVVVEVVVTVVVVEVVTVVVAVVEMAAVVAAVVEVLSVYIINFIFDIELCSLIYLQCNTKISEC